MTVYNPPRSHNISVFLDGPPVVEVNQYEHHTHLKVGTVDLFAADLAELADLNERIGIAITAAMLDAKAAAAVALSPSRLRSLPDRERIAVLTAEEYEAERAGERRIDAATKENDE